MTTKERFQPVASAEWQAMAAAAMKIMQEVVENPPTEIQFVNEETGKVETKITKEGVALEVIRTHLRKASQT